MPTPDFWLEEGDSFWHSAPSALACYVIAGPTPMIEEQAGKQWLVRVDPPIVEGAGIITDRVLVDCHQPNWRDGEDWAIVGTGAWALQPWVPENQRKFKIFRSGQTFGSQKVVVTTRLDWDPGAK